MLCYHHLGGTTSRHCDGVPGAFVGRRTPVPPATVQRRKAPLRHNQVSRSSITSSRARDHYTRQCHPVKSAVRGSLPPTRRQDLGKCRSGIYGWPMSCKSCWMSRRCRLSWRAMTRSTWPTLISPNARCKPAMANSPGASKSKKANLMDHPLSPAPKAWYNRCLSQNALVLVREDGCRPDMDCEQVLG